MTRYLVVNTAYQTSPLYYDFKGSPTGTIESQHRSLKAAERACDRRNATYTRVGGLPPCRVVTIEGHTRRQVWLSK